jgi:hypothetical protein
MYCAQPRLNVSYHLASWVCLTLGLKICNEGINYKIHPNFTLLFTQHFFRTTLTLGLQSRLRQRQGNNPKLNLKHDENETIIQMKVKMNGFNWKHS